jgi:hypothetical protein
MDSLKPALASTLATGSFLGYRNEQMFRQNWIIAIAACLFLFSAGHEAHATGTPNAIQRALDLLKPSSPVPLPTALDNLAKTSADIIKESMLWSQKTHEALRADASEIAATLLFAVLFAEITFTGFRLMLGSSIIEQLGLLTTKTFIYVIVAGLVPFPGATAPYNSADAIIRTSMFRLMHGGKYVGFQIIKTAAHPSVLAIPDIAAMDMDPATAIPPKDGWSSGVSWLGAPFSAVPDPFGRERRFTGAGGGYGDAGAFGPESAAAGTTNPAGRAEPIVYWTSWLGLQYADEYKFDNLRGLPLPTDAQLIRDGKEYKYSQISMNARIWGEDPESPDGSVSAKLRENASALPGAGGGTGGFSQWEDFARGALTGVMPLQMFGLALTVAGIQIGSLVTVLFTQMSILIGSITAFNIASALGLAVLPLMYFRMFDKIWSQYLIGLASLALVPCFYYVLSAIGFVFSTFAFEMLFPLPANLSPAGAPSSNLAMSVMLNELFFAVVSSTMQSFSLFTGALGKFFEWAISSLVAVYLILGRIMFGTTIIAAFVSAGALFTVLAPRFAFRWQQAFGAEDVIEKISEVFNGLQSAIGSGMGQMYSDALSRGSSMLRGAGRGGSA